MDINSFNHTSVMGIGMQGTSDASCQHDMCNTQNKEINNFLQSDLRIMRFILISLSYRKHHTLLRHWP